MLQIVCYRGAVRTKVFGPFSSVRVVVGTVRGDGKDVLWYDQDGDDGWFEAETKYTIGSLHKSFEIETVQNQVSIE